MKSVTVSGILKTTALTAIVLERQFYEFQVGGMVSVFSPGRKDNWDD